MRKFMTNSKKVSKSRMSFLSFVPFWNTISESVSQRVVRFILSQSLGKYLNLESEIVFGSNIQLSSLTINLLVSFISLMTGSQ